DPPAERDLPEPAAAEPAQDVLLGRDEVIGHFVSVLEAATAGRGGAFMIAGDPGIGKTHLLEHCADRMRTRGTTARTGRCYEGAGSPAFCPWIQILRAHFAAEHAVDEYADVLTDLAEISRIVPEVRSRFPGIQEPPPLEGADSRFRMFDAATRVLLHSARK